MSVVASGTFNVIIVAGGGVLVLLGVFLLFNIVGAADRAARRGKELKSGYSQEDLLMDNRKLVQPTTRAGARSLGAAVIVVFSIGIFARLTGH